MGICYFFLCNGLNIVFFTFTKADLLQYKTHNIIIASALKSVILKLDSFLTLLSEIVAETELQCLNCIFPTTLW